MTIVVGTDFSNAAAEALHIGALLSARLSEPLHVAHVSQDSRAELLVGTDAESLLVEDRRRLDGAVASARGTTAGEITYELAAGPCVDALCEAAERREAHVLIVGETGDGGAPRGRTAEGLMRAARVPVMVVRAQDRLRGWLEHARPLSVLIGSDLGAAARDAEDFVALLDRAGPIRAHVVHVAHPPAAHARYGLPPPADINRLEPAAEQRLREELERAGTDLSYRERRDVRIVSGMSAADTHLAILSEGADLVVVGARKRSWISQLWYGSVASGLLRSAPVSVACVPHQPGTRAARHQLDGGVVVAATDLSELGDEAIAAALAIAKPGATVHVVHVLPKSFEHDAGARGALRRQLHKRIPAPGDRTVHADVLIGEPATAILSFARKRGASLICVSSHGRTGLGALVLGSTSQEVIAGASIPVLVVPPTPP